MAKKTYMVAIKRKVTVEAILYHEVIAESVAEAMEAAKEQEAENPISDKAWVFEAAYSIRNGESEMGKIHFECCGRASQYHSPAECKICRQVEKEENKGK